MLPPSLAGIMPLLLLIKAVYTLGMALALGVIGRYHTEFGLCQMLSNKSHSVCSAAVHLHALI